MERAWWPHCESRIVNRGSSACLPFRVVSPTIAQYEIPVCRSFRLQVGIWNSSRRADTSTVALYRTQNSHIRVDNNMAQRATTRVRRAVIMLRHCRNLGREARNLKLTDRRGRQIQSCGAVPNRTETRFDKSLIGPVTSNS